MKGNCEPVRFGSVLSVLSIRFGSIRLAWPVRFGSVRLVESVRVGSVRGLLPSVRFGTVTGAWGIQPVPVRGGSIRTTRFGSRSSCIPGSPI